MVGAFSRFMAFYANLPQSPRLASGLLNGRPRRQEMRDFSDLRTCELLALGRRALELAGRHFDRIAPAASPEDEPLRALLQRMSLDSSIRAAEVEQRENLYPEESMVSSFPEEALRLIRGYLTSLSRSFGEGPLNRDAAL